MSAIAITPGWLPWDRNSGEERLFRKALAIVMGVSLLFGGVLPLIDVPAPPREEAEAIPPRLAHMLLEREVPLPPPVRVERPVEEKKAEPVPVPVQEPRVAAARKRAAQSGVLAMSRELAALSTTGVLDKATSRTTLSRGGREAARSESTMERNAVQGSGGIDTAMLPREQGAAPAPEEHATTTLVVAQDELAQASAPTRAPQRNVDAINEKLDRNKGMIHVIYSRALRRNPLLAGNVIFSITIEPSGKVSACRIVSSELGDEELERKLVARITMIDFGAEAVPQGTFPWAVNFLPN